MTALPAERSGFAASADLLARRAGVDAAVAVGMWSTDPAPTEVWIGGIRCLRFSPRTRPWGTVVHLHGGAFRIGRPEQLGPFAAALALRCHVEVICPAYRLAPEHPFPAGLCDAWSVVRALAGSGPLLVSGDSAGGGLAAGVAALTGLASIDLVGLALLSPWLDLSVTAASYAENAAHDPLFSADAARTAAALYLQGHPPADPLASPLYGPVASYPPTFLNVGSREVLVDDTQHLHDRLHQAGVPVQLRRIEGMDHVAVTRGLTLSGSAETLAQLGQFVDQVMPRLDAVSGSQ